MRHGFLGFALLVATFAVRAEFPDKPIRIIVPFAAGGGADATARIIAEPLSKALKQPVVVENKPGGDSVIGSIFVAKSPPDGYTLLFGTNTGLSAAPYLHRDIGYDPLKDFTPVSAVGSFAYFLVINPEVPARTFREFVSLARARPGTMNYASGNSMGIVGSSQIALAEKLDMAHVPYKGENAAMPDLLANRVQMLFATGFIVPHVKEGKVRALAAILDDRSKALPDVPTIAEAGFPELKIRAWAGIFGPAGMPPEVTARLSRELGAVIASSAVQEQLALQGFMGKGSTPAELAASVKAQLEQWGEVIRAAGIKPD